MSAGNASSRPHAALASWPFSPRLDIEVIPLGGDAPVSHRSAGGAPVPQGVEGSARSRFSALSVLSQ